MPRAVTNNDPKNNGVPSQTGAKDVAKRPAVPTAASEKGEPNVHEIPYQVDVKDKTYTYNIDVPGAVANNDSNNHGPEDGQTNCMADNTETERIAMTAITTEERGAGGHN